MALQSTTAIATITLQQASTTVTFSGIPNTYRDLILVGSGQRTSSSGSIFIRLNGDAGTNYSEVAMFGNGSSASSFAGTYNAIFQFGLGSPTSIGQSTAQFLDYSTDNKHKTLLIRHDTPNAITMAVAQRWASNSPINTIVIGDSAGSMTAGSTFSLYGRIA